MRLITTPSHHSYYLAGIFLALTLPAIAGAYTVTGDGCFERAAGVMRLTEPTCTLTVSADAVEQVSFSFENVDPESVEITSTDVTLETERTSTSLAVSFTVETIATVTVTPWYEVGDDLWFVAMSDNQASGTVEANPIFEDMLPLIGAINPVFMTNAGDLIQGSSDEDTVHDMFAAVLDTLEETTVPMYPTPGNHDHNDDLGIYESYFGAVDYSYDYGPAHFIALSSSGTTSRGTVTTDQQAWLTTELTATELQSIVYFHHPLSVPSWGKSTCCFEDMTERDDLAATLEANGVDQAINGHSQGYDWRLLTAGDVSSLEVGLYQLISGGGGGNIAQPDGDYHFTLVHVTPNDITHQVFELSDTDIVIDDSADNEIIVEYDGVADLPYLRLKFRLDSNIPQYLIVNEAGDYLPYIRHDFEDDAVLFVETSVSSGTTTFTAQPASTLHTGSSQSINASGYVTFASAPSTTASNTGIAVLPSKLTTTISELTATEDGYTWLEQPASRSTNTAYTLSDLPATADVQVFVNDRLYIRGQTNTIGQFEFEFATNRSDRAFRVIVQSGIPTIVTVPTDSGTAHVRTFTKSGENTGNFFSANNRTGNFKVQYTYLTDVTEPNLLVTDLTKQRLLVHAVDGTKLATLYTTGEVHTGDRRLYLAQKGSIRSYRWSSTKQKFIAVDRWRPAGRLMDWTVVGDEIVAITKIQNRYITSTKTKSITLPPWLQSVQVVPCRCLASVTTNALVVWQKNNRISFSNYSTDLVKHSTKTIRQSGEIEQVVTGHITDQKLDTVVLVSQDVAYLLQAKASGKFNRLPNVTAIDQVGVVNGQLVTTTNTRPALVNVYDYNNLLNEFELDESFYPYGETFMGGATLAVP